MGVKVIQGDCREVLRELPADSIHAVVTDPPYGLSREPDINEVLRHWLAGDDYAARGGGFMSREWDSFVPGPATWKEVFRVMKPGAHMLCFAGTRTQDLMGISLRMAGFEIRDCIRYEQGQEAWPAWIFGQGFPKSLAIDKAIDDHFFHQWLKENPEQATRLKGAPKDKKKEVEAELRRMAGVAGSFGKHKSVRHATPRHYAEGMERPWHSDPDAIDRNGREYLPATPEAQEWAGYGTQLKPAYEPIICARKPLSEPTIAANVLKHGTGGLNINACRVNTGDPTPGGGNGKGNYRYGDPGHYTNERPKVEPHIAGRFPANLIHDGSPELLEAFAKFPVHSAGSARAEPGGGSYDGSKGIGFAKDGSRIGINRRGFRIGDSGTAARFFFSSKAGRDDRNDSNHPTVKPLALIEYLCKLICPPGSTVLDPFAGTGTTGFVADRLGHDAILVELDPEYCKQIRQRIQGNSLFSVVI